jgi:transcriptional regulator with GAF, ATPase, and Fis domain
MSNGSDHDDHIHAAMAELVTSFPINTVSVADTLAGVTAAAVDLIDGVDHADIMLIEKDRFESLAATAPVVVELDAAQERLGQGPCLQAAVADSVIRCTDLREEARWPQFAAAAIKLGVYSMLSFQLYTGRGGAGALNLLGSAPRAFSLEAEALGAMLATHAAVALAAVKRERQFESALASRDRIGQAKGILMERFNVDAVQAFELLKRLSQTSNTPLRTVAERLISTSR